LSVIPHYNDKFVEDIEAGMDKIPKVMPPDLRALRLDGVSTSRRV